MKHANVLELKTQNKCNDIDSLPIISDEFALVSLDSEYTHVCSIKDTAHYHKLLFSILNPHNSLSLSLSPFSIIMTGSTPENQTAPAPPPVKHVPESVLPAKPPKRNKYAFACAILASMTSILLGYG